MCIATVYASYQRVQSESRAAGGDTAGILGALGPSSAAMRIFSETNHVPVLLYLVYFPTPYIPCRTTEI